MVNIMSIMRSNDYLEKSPLNERTSVSTLLSDYFKY